MIANGPAPYGGMLGGVFGFGAPPQQIRQETRRLSETEIDDRIRQKKSLLRAKLFP